MPYDRIIYFGDSQTDSDEFFSLASQLALIPIPSPAFGYAGQFSNGDVYADTVPELLGIGADESVNYAVGGARAIGTFPLGLVLASSEIGIGVENATPEQLAFDSFLTAQVQRFLADVPSLGDLSGSAASFFIGLNDFNDFASTFADPTLTFEEQQAAAATFVSTLVTTIITQASIAASAGVGTIILHTLPVGSFFPNTAGLDPAFFAVTDAAVRGFNDALVAQAATLETLGVNVEVVDFEAMADVIAAEGATFGFLNTTESLLDTTTGIPEPIDTDGDMIPDTVGIAVNPELAALDQDQFVYFDNVHWTEAAHGVFAAFEASVLSGETVTFDGESGGWLWLDRADDLVFAQGGNDKVLMGKGDDVGFGGAGRDLIFAGLGDDIAAGGADNDLIFGGRGNDVLAGNEGDDVTNGGFGHDVLVDGLGNDVMRGGWGNDSFLYTDNAMIGGSTGESFDFIHGGRGWDTLYLVVSDEARAAVEAELADFSCFGRGNYIETLDVYTRSVEEVVLLDTRADFETLTLPSQAIVDEAEAWGLI